jgi:hypothetical protein
VLNAGQRHHVEPAHERQRQPVLPGQDLRQHRLDQIGVGVDI